MRVVRCPICRSEVSWEENPHRPFYSERCRLLDLGGWIEDRYRIPGKTNDPEDKRDDDNDDDESR